MSDKLNRVIRLEGDKRSVSTDALETLGTIIDDKAGRDAIHLAVEPAIAAVKLFPGQDVGFMEGGVGPCDTPLGIVDPFLKTPVQPGQMFWLVVYPRQITSLRHVWSHPAFPETASVPQKPTVNKVESELWLRTFIEISDCPDYDTVIAVASGERLEGDYGPSYNDGENLHFNGRDAHGSIPPEFWTHLEVVTGKHFAAEERAGWFSCSC